MLERWKEYEGDPFYRALFGDEELVELSRQVFGEIEGTERLSGAGRSRLS